MVLLDHFANKSNTFLSPPLSLPLSLSHFFPFPPWVSTSNPGFQDCAINGADRNILPKKVLLVQNTIFGPFKFTFSFFYPFFSFFKPYIMKKNTIFPGSQWKTFCKGGYPQFQSMNHCCLSEAFRPERDQVLTHILT